MSSNSTTFTIFLNDLMSRGLIDIGRTGKRELDKVEREVDKLDRKNRKAEKSAGGIGNAYRKVSSIIATGGIVYGLGLIAKKGLDAAGSFETTNAKFETLLGSTKKAKALIADLEKFSTKTPFTPAQLNESAEMMLNFGIANEKIMPNLRALGDVSGGNGEKLKSLTLAFSQMTSTGHLMGQDLLQMINAGFNPLKTIADKTGKSMGQLKEEMSKGAISSDMVRDAFIAATSAGGSHYGMMDKISKTYEGKLSTAAGNLNFIFRDLGQRILPIINNALDWFNKNWNTIIPTLTTALYIIGPLGAAILAYSTYTKIASIVTNVMTGAQWLLNAALDANPIGLVIALIVALAAAFTLAYKKSDTFRGMINGVWESLKQMWENIKGLFSFKSIVDVFTAVPRAIVASFKDVGSLFKAIFSGDFKAIPGILKSLGANLIQTSPIGALGAKIFKGTADAFKRGQNSENEAAKAAGEKAFLSGEGSGNGLASPSLSSDGSIPDLSGSRSEAAKLKGVTGSAKTAKNINVRIDKLVETLSINSSQIAETPAKIKDMISEALIDAVRDAELSFG